MLGNSVTTMRFGLPVALQRLHLAAADQELAAVLLDGAGDLLPVLLEPCWIGHLVVDDEIRWHAAPPHDVVASSRSRSTSRDGPPMADDPLMHDQRAASRKIPNASNVTASASFEALANLLSVGGPSRTRTLDPLVKRRRGFVSPIVPFRQQPTVRGV
jgi:hypothetical protein